MHVGVGVGVRMECVPAPNSVVDYLKYSKTNWLVSTLLCASRRAVCVCV